MTVVATCGRCHKRFSVVEPIQYGALDHRCRPVWAAFLLNRTEMPSGFMLGVAFSLWGALAAGTVKHVLNAVAVSFYAVTGLVWLAQWRRNQWGA